ncbi:RNA polymerase, alpha chain C terminal domain [Geodermatophilus telluris]|uniref:RNA polymerase, alpha chain C terminal domain n=1 Tax=Geodermatophilus telluris TaxID=1190417 RepID=A0A1G6V7K6_9ACTN|nr:helix-hairpin-helix domain-containing protein [Geodermatophilus telluris]SDD49670.1 RNA polymerase, alpha chain C terminal domain [Geodermatophilus telluris]
MVTRSPGNRSGRGVQDLQLPGRAVAALARAGVTEVADLAALTRRELAAIPGLGPSTVAAIRAVVPEPPARLPRAEPLPEPEDEGPASPAIPSFDSLRSPQRRTAIDLLVPGTEGDPPPPGDPEPERSVPDAPPVAPRPAEWADLWRLGWRVTCWWVQQPVRTVRRLLG